MNTDGHYWTVIVELSGEGGPNHANGLDTVRVLREIGCRHYRLIGINCAMATVPLALIETARLQKGVACSVEIDCRCFTVYIQPCRQPRKAA